MIVLYFPDSHPSYPMWYDWCKQLGIKLVSSVRELEYVEGTYLFLLSCIEVLHKDIYGRFGTACVIHEADLPRGRGWSPMAWQILEGKKEIVISAIVCAEKPDRGDIIAKRTLTLDGTELSDEINYKRNLVRQQLVLDVVNATEPPVPQTGEPTYYPRRYPCDSQLDTWKSIAEQFDLLRICDPRFPAFFEHRGCRYIVKLEKVVSQ